MSYWPIPGVPSMSNPRLHYWAVWLTLVPYRVLAWALYPDAEYSFTFVRNDGEQQALSGTAREVLAGLRLLHGRWKIGEFMPRGSGS